MYFLKWRLFCCCCSNIKEIQTWRQKKDEIEIGKHEEEKDTLIVENIPMISERGMISKHWIKIVFFFIRIYPDEEIMYIV